MANIEVQYLDLVRRILTQGELKDNRTGVPTYAVAGAMLEHDMSEGFPLLTARKLPYKNTKVELEFFIKGLNDKRWLQERGCPYWNGWCDPRIVPYAKDGATKARMTAEPMLGECYGRQWRDFKDPHSKDSVGVDQLKRLVETLKTNPNDRRMIVSAWNPLALDCTALPSCHYSFQVTVIGEKLNLAWNQRSVDTYLGLPANIASYATLLHLLAKEAGLKEGKLIGFLMDVHLYENHIRQARELITRKIYPLPIIKTEKFTSVFDWEYKDSELVGYQSGPVLSAEVAI